WYRARGYYDARVLSTRSNPPAALYGSPTREQEISLHVSLREGEPVRIRSAALDGIESLAEPLGQTLLEALEALPPGERFDEAVYDETQRTLLRELRNAGHAAAELKGRVDVDPLAK